METITSSDDLTRWDENLRQFLPGFLGQLKSGSTLRGMRIVQVSDLYLTEGILAWTASNLAGLREGLTKSALAHLSLLKRSRAGEDIKPGLADSYVIFQPMLLAILADNPSLAAQIAELYGARPPDRQDHPYHVHTGRAMKYAVTGATTDARAEIEELKEKDVLKNVKKLALLFKAIILNDQQGVKSALPQALAEFDTECRGPLRGLPASVLFLDGLGLLKLNHMINQADVELPQDPRLPAALLQDRPAVSVDIGF